MPQRGLDPKVLFPDGTLGISLSVVCLHSYREQETTLVLIFSACADLR